MIKVRAIIDLYQRIKLIGLIGDQRACEQEKKSERESTLVTRREISRTFINSISCHRCWLSPFYFPFLKPAPRFTFSKSYRVRGNEVEIMCTGDDFMTIVILW